MVITSKPILYCFFQISILKYSYPLYYAILCLLLVFFLKLCPLLYQYAFQNLQLGILIKAKTEGFIEKIKPLLDELTDREVWISEKLKNEVLKKTEEK